MIALMLAVVLMVAPATGTSAKPSSAKPSRPIATAAARDTITVGGGCFWCTEAVFDELAGVDRVTSGFSGGTVAHPSYELVSTGTTGHAETNQIVFDPRVIPLHDLLEIFFTVHDPTTLNRQGNDAGTQYRSVIFYRNERQRAVATEVMKDVTARKIWPDPLVTQLEPFRAFWPAEGYHQNYFARNGGEPYCQFIIAPKVAKFRAHWLSRLKTKS